MNGMERYAWKAILKDGKKEEYIRRHNEIWEELVEVLKNAGIENCFNTLVNEPSHMTVGKLCRIAFALRRDCIHSKLVYFS